MTTLNRKVGIEMEGYLDTYPRKVELIGASIGQDGSLENNDWEYDDEAYGVEIRTDPLTNLTLLDAMWKEMSGNGWDTDDRAGTHIHVDISDFSTSEKVKLLRFGKGIERIMFMFVDDYRNGNEYCDEIHKHWRVVFREGSRYKNINWDEIETKNVNDYLVRHYARKNHNDFDYWDDSVSAGTLWNGKYQWMNIFGSRYPTVEYRLFHAVRDLDEIKMQARTAVAICDLVKNSTLEQLEFILQELYKQPSVEAITDKFFEALGLDFKLNLSGTTAMNYLTEKLSAKSDAVAV